MRGAGSGEIILGFKMAGFGFFKEQVGSTSHGRSPEAQRGPGELVDLQGQPPQNAQGHALPMCRRTSGCSRQLPCFNGEFLSQPMQTLKYMEDVNSGRPLWRT